jgi:2-dehydro-3-deoxygluconokinase
VLAAVPGERAAMVVDTTGAGDAWNGSFLHRLMQGDAPEAAAAVANRLAAGTLAHRGALPPRDAFG